MFRDITIFSGELEIENILTIGDIFDYNLSWDFEEREEGRQYPGIGETRFSRIEVFGTFSNFKDNKVGCVFSMVVDSIVLHAEFGPNGHQKDALHFIKSNLEPFEVFNYILRHEFETAKTELDDELE